MVTPVLVVGPPLVSRRSQQLVLGNRRPHAKMEGAPVVRICSRMKVDVTPFQ
jgi:hypothetical protein